MSVSSCPSCNKQVSQYAFDCPHCGHPIRKPKRGIFGKLFKLLFILFNILMIIWIIAGLHGAGEVIDKATSEAEAAGAAIGTTIGVTMLLGFWVMGDIILGFLVLFTKPSK